MSGSNRRRDSRRCPPFLFWLCAASALPAQTAPLASRSVPVAVRSGNHANPTPVEGVVFRELVTMPPGTPWLRLCFGRTWLSSGSYLRLVSLRDGDVMTMHQEHLEQWSHTSAYFNGNVVLVELIAGPGTSKNYVEVDKVLAGETPSPAQQPATICGPNDERFPTADPRIARVMPGGCTAWIAEVPVGASERCHLSAGHCYGPAQVLQFNVPASAADCSLVHPPAARQFAIDTTMSQHVDHGLGDDYWVFRCFRNPTTGYSTFEYQGYGVPLAPVLPALGTQLRVIGHGLDGTDGNMAPGGNASCGCAPGAGTGTRNQTLQTNIGPLTAASGTMVQYQIDTCGGNSGSPVTDHIGGAAFAIHTHGGCGTPVGTTANTGTRITHPGLQAALAQVAGSPSQPGTSPVSAFTLTAGGNGPYHNRLTSSLAPFTVLSAGIASFTWFRLHSGRLRPEALYTFATCSPTRNIDTVLEVFEGSTGELVFVDGNDDACGQGSSLTVDLQPDTTYYVRVGGKAGQVGDFDVLVVAPYSANDDCEGAVTLARGRNAGLDNLAATTSANAWPCAANAGNDLWFVYQVAAANLQLTFTTCDPATTFDTVLEVLRGDCGGLVSLGCNDDAVAPVCASNWQASTVVVQSPPPGPLQVRVGGANHGQGSFAIDIVEQPVNDECWSALPLTTGRHGPFSTVGASTSPEPWPCGPGGADVWFTCTAPCTGQLAITTCTTGRSFDTVLEVFTGACGGLWSLGCNDDAGAGCGTGSMLNLRVNANQPLWIRLGGHNGAQGVTELQIDCVPMADECPQAIPVALGSNGPFSNVAATTSAQPVQCGGMANDVWFAYLATCSAPHTFRTCSPVRTFDTVLEVLQGGCLAPVSLGCNDDACDGLGSQLTVPLLAGRMYRVRVGGFAGAVGNFELGIEPGTGGGSIATTGPGCGPATIAVVGEPRIGGTLVTTVGNVAGLSFIGLGFGAPAPFCGCTIGHDWAVAVFGTMHVLTVPCDPAYIGAPVRIQGADLFGIGGCANPPVAFTATVTATIG